jgi:hypothetical protein
MHRILGETFLAALQPFAITPPLHVQRIAEVLQHIGSLNGDDVGLALPAHIVIHQML